MAWIVTWALIRTVVFVQATFTPNYLFRCWACCYRLRLLANNNFIIIFKAFWSNLDIFESFLNWFNFLDVIICALLRFNFLLNALRFLLSDLLILRFFKKMLWLAIEVGLGLLLCASIASYSTCKIVILTLATDPATIRECEVLLLSFVCLVALKFGHNLWFLAFLLLFILSPFQRSNVETIIFLIFLLFLNFGLCTCGQTFLFCFFLGDYLRVVILFNRLCCVHQACWLLDCRWPLRGHRDKTGWISVHSQVAFIFWMIWSTLIRIGNAFPSHLNHLLW